MCFIIDKDNPNGRIAEKDIMCYKTLYSYINTQLNARIFRSLFFDFRYVENELYELEKPKALVNENGLINRGFHSFTKVNTALNGLFAERVLVQCIIPKGSEYYVNNHNNEYVSNKIIIKKLLIYKQ